jgi:asparagine synthetase B (glutamine-hydrolysing)
MKCKIFSNEVFSFESKSVVVKAYGDIYNKSYLNKIKHCKTDDQIVQAIQQLSGFFFIYIRKDNIEYFINDIFGNFRLYFFTQDGEITISDDIQYILESCQPECLHIDTNEAFYFRRHRYTTGNNSLYKGIAKMPPASLWKYSSNGLLKNIYFDSFKCFQKIDNYPESNYQYIYDNIKDSIDPNLETILYFSGGVDSTYLYFVLKDLAIKFKLVFIKYSPYDKDNLDDLHKVLKIAKVINESVEIIDCDIDKYYGEFQKKLHRRHPFDMSLFSIYYGNSVIHGKYGSCNIVNGQSSDSIYCWGNSSKSISAAIQRFMVSKFYYDAPLSIRRLLAMIIQNIYKIRWKSKYTFYIPFKEKEYYIGLLDPTGYVPVICGSNSYQKYLLNIVDALVKNVAQKKDVVMYLKMMYLQGPSNIMVIESSKEFNHNLIMPFLDARIVFLKLKFQNEIKNIFQPRYELEEVLYKRYNFDTNEIKKAKKYKVTTKQKKIFFSYKNLILKINQEWLVNLGLKK